MVGQSVGTFADSLLGADHGVVFQHMQGEIDLWNGFLVGKSALERVGTGAGHNGYRCVERRIQGQERGERVRTLQIRSLV